MFKIALLVFVLFSATDFGHSYCDDTGKFVTTATGRHVYIWTATDGWCIARVVDKEPRRDYKRAKEICEDENEFGGSLLKKKHKDDFKQSLNSTGDLNTYHYWTGFPEDCGSKCPFYQRKEADFFCANCTHKLLYVCQYPGKETTTIRKSTTTTTTTQTPTTTTTTTTQTTTTATIVTPTPSTTTVFSTILQNVSKMSTDLIPTTKYPIYVKNLVLATAIACAIIGTIFLIAAMIVRSKGMPTAVIPKKTKGLAQRRNVKSLFKSSENF